MYKYLGMGKDFTDDIELSRWRIGLILLENSSHQQSKNTVCASRLVSANLFLMIECRTGGYDPLLPELESVNILSNNGHFSVILEICSN
jgi:hypothetical protein